MLFRKKLFRWNQAAGHCLHRGKSQSRNKSTFHFSRNHWKRKEEDVQLEVARWKSWLAFVRNFLVSPKLCPIFVSKPNDNRLYLNVKISSFNFFALIDTGSNSSILGLEGFSLLQKLKIPLRYEDHLHITTADGSSQSLLGFVNVNVSVENVSKRLKLLVVPSVTHSLILSMDFLHLK